MSRISEEISKILGFRIHEGQWKGYLGTLDVSGEPTRKNMAALIFAVCEEIENIEKKLEEKPVINANVERTGKGYNPKKSV